MERSWSEFSWCCPCKVILYFAPIDEIRAIYFSVYSQGKHTFTALNNNQETSLVHMASAASGIQIIFIIN